MNDAGKRLPVQTDRAVIQDAIAAHLAGLLIACDRAAHDEFREGEQTNAPDTRSRRRASAARLARAAAALSLAINKIAGETRHCIVVRREY